MKANTRQITVEMAGSALGLIYLKTPMSGIYSCQSTVWIAIQNSKFPARGRAK